MLILTRREEQGIVIGKAGDVLSGPIRVRTLKTHANRAKLGIDCQTDIEVHREEVSARPEPVKPHGQETLYFTG